MVAFAPQKIVTNCIAIIFGMLAPINFNDEFALAADKISYVRTDGLLPNELESPQSAVTQLKPELSFNIRRIAPQATIIQLSARSGAGMEAWYAWLRALPAGS